MAGKTKQNEQATEQVVEQTTEQATEQAPELVVKEPKRVEVKLPRNPGHNAIQDEFYSVNFKNYIIRRGEYVEVPEAVAEVIKNQEKDEDYAMRFVEEHALREA